MELGRHIGISDGFYTSATYAKNIGCTFFQIFLGSPMCTKNKKKNQKDLLLFKKQLKENDIRMVIHASYTINLAHPNFTPKYNSSVKSLIQDLDASAILGKRCLGVIIHMGKNIPSNKISDFDAIKNYIFGIKECLFRTPKNSTIILETGASQGSEIASTITGMSNIFSKLKKTEQKRVKFCIDTCHIWASGYDISTAQGVRNYLKEFDEKIGLSHIVCIHLNDSKNSLGSCVDRHADIGYGQIGINGLKYMVRWAKKNKIPLVMETPLTAVNKITNRDITHTEQMDLVLSWINKN